MSDNDKIKELEKKLAESEKKLKIKELEKKISSNKKKTTLNEYEGLYCSSDDKIIFGFCGGLAHKFGLQTGVVRFAVFLSLFFFIGWFYFVGLFLPKHSTK